MIKLKENALEIYRETNPIRENNIEQFLIECSGRPIYEHRNYSDTYTVKVSRYQNTTSFIIPKMLTEERFSEDEGGDDKIESQDHEGIIGKLKSNIRYIIFVIFLISILVYGYNDTKNKRLEQQNKQIEQSIPEKDKFDTITETITFTEKTIDEEYRLQEEMNIQIAEMIKKKELSIERVRAYRQKQQEMYTKKLNLLIR